MNPWALSEEECVKLIEIVLGGGGPAQHPKAEVVEDEFFATEAAARAGVVFENPSQTEPLVLLRYFGPEVNPEAPAMGAYRQS